MVPVKVCFERHGMANLIGHDIGRYHIVEQLGQGGMATVYKAYDTRLEREVAIKVIRMGSLPPDAVEHMLKRFDREAKSLARLEHPNIIPIHDYGEYEGSPYLVMRYIPGGTLKNQAGEAMPYQQACRLLIPVAHALAYAHSQNVIHRDVKPANILITSAGEPMLSDFGVAKILEIEEGNTLTGTGVGIGTPEYMAPEQWINRVIPQTDIYALGVVFYELITGHKPFTADTPAAVLLKQTIDPLPRPRQFVPDLPEQVEHVIFKAMAKKPEERFASMKEFAAAMEKLATREDQAQPTAPIKLKVSAGPEGVKVKPGAGIPLPEPDITVDRGQPTRPPAAAKRNGIPAWIYFVVGGPLLVLVTGGIWLSEKMPAATPTPVPTLAPTSLPSPTETDIPTLVPTATVLVPTATQILATPTEAYGIGSTYISPKDRMKMVYIPAGEFQMGYDQGNPDEKPAHKVYLDGFWIDQTEVTNSMYVKCVSAGSCAAPQRNNFQGKPGYPYDSSQYADYPVVGVGSDQADIYCTWVVRRLPTEAEWEKAARGTDGRLYPWGNQPPEANLALYRTSDVKILPVKVGSYPQGASPYGVLDMVGNAAEFVADWYDSGYYARSPDRNPTGPLSPGQSDRVLRGGDFTLFSSFMRSTFRGNFSGVGGIRCALSTLPLN
jgi:eukaryotic-like serine/threonine-protein kinase